MEVLTRDKSGCTKFHPIGNDKRASVDRTDQLSDCLKLAGNVRAVSDARFHEGVA